MCFKSCKNSRLLNPSAQEWRPADQQNRFLQSHETFPVNSQPVAVVPPPPHAAVQVVAYAASPNHKLPPWCSYTLFLQEYIIPGRCTPPYSLPVYQPAHFSLPETEPSYEATPPISGGELEGPVIQNKKSATVGKTYFPHRLWSMRSLSMEEKAPRRRQVWRPRKSVAATSSPPCNSIPKQLYAAPPPCEKLSSSPKTTVMIKNIPNQLRRGFILEFMDRCCKAHSLEYDFLYLPMDFRKEDNLGYAFVNFTTTGGAIKFKKIMHNYEWGTFTTERGEFTSKKICEITWATIQGKDGQVKRFQNSIFACDNPEFLPVMLDPPRNGSNTEVAPPATVGTLRQKSNNP